jgi:predicted PurR-regulated permease PerM
MNTSDASYKLLVISRLCIITAVSVALLYLGKPLFIPMSFGLLLAIICYPMCRWMERKGWPRTLSVAVAITLIALIFIALLVMLGYEMTILSEHKPEIIAKLSVAVPEFRTWLDETLGVNMQTQGDLLDDITAGLSNSGTSLLNGVFSATTSLILSLILIPLFAVLFLLHRNTFVRFFETVAGERHKADLTAILRESISSYFHFVKGTFFVYCIVGVLNSAGLLMLGIDHAILFGMIAAFMTIIPYVGIIISASLPIAIALITKDSWWYAAGVIIVFSVVQYLEANIIYPRVVGKQLNVSTWAILVTIIAGTILWGLSGMILFVPFVGILKIFSDHIPELKPLNILLSRTEKAKKSN